MRDHHIYRGPLSWFGHVNSVLFLSVTIMFIKGYSVGFVLLIQGLFLPVTITFIEGQSVGLVVLIQAYFYL